MAKSSEEELVAAIATAQADYRAAAQTASRAKLAEIEARLEGRRKQLAALLSYGAKVCGCGQPPHGMRCEDLVTIAGQRHLVPYYVVGCLKCSNTRATGLTAKEAVKKWNAGDLIPVSVELEV